MKTLRCFHPPLFLFQIFSLLAFQLFAFSSPSCAKTIEEGLGIVFGENYAFNLKAPKGWVLDNESGADQGVHAVFYPKGGTWADSVVVAYAKARDRSDKIVTADDAAKFVIADFHANGSPKYEGKRIGTIKTKSGGEAVIYHFSGDEWGNREAVAYYVEKKTINFLVMTSRDKKTFEKSLPAFEQLAASYVYMGDAPVQKAPGK